MNNQILLIGAAVGCLFLMGCSGGNQTPPTFSVTGKVTYQGAAVEGATIQFVPGDAETKGANAITQADGTYALSTFKPGDGAMPGKYNVTVRKLVSVEQGIQRDGENAGQPAYVNKDMLPTKYRSQGSTPLEFEVTEDGENTFDIDLTN